MSNKPTPQQLQESIDAYNNMVRVIKACVTGPAMSRFMREEQVRISREKCQRTDNKQPRDDEEPPFEF